MMWGKEGDGIFSSGQFESIVVSKVKREEQEQIQVEGIAIYAYTLLGISL